MKQTVNIVDYFDILLFDFKAFLDYEQRSLKTGGSLQINHINDSLDGLFKNWLKFKQQFICRNLKW